MAKIAFIGAGNMAEAIVGGVLSKGIFSKEDLILSDISKDRLAFIANKFGVLVCSTNLEAAKNANAIILAVKPNVVLDVLREISLVVDNQLLISIAAGITTTLIEETIGKAVRVIRVMPNTPALIGKGAAAYCCGRYAKNSDKEFVEKIMGAIGFICEMEEKSLNAVTALSGSGPAYVFYLAEAMIEAGIKMGLSEKKSYELTVHTIAGAGELLRKMKEPPASLRAKVTSKGGTTEAAIKVMDENKLKEILKLAILAAERRANELTK